MLDMKKLKADTPKAEYIEKKKFNCIINSKITTKEKQAKQRKRTRAFLFLSSF